MKASIQKRNPNAHVTNNCLGKEKYIVRLTFKKADPFSWQHFYGLTGPFIVVKINNLVSKWSG